MKKYDSKDIRNIALIGHSGSGKTSLAETFLFNAKATTRLGRVDEGNSNFDFEPEEIKYQCSISAAVGVCEWKKRKLNILDTPGDPNFLFDTQSFLAVADSALAVISAVDGVEVHTVKTWQIAESENLARLIFINKMDRERADFERTLADIRENLTPNAVALQVPVGKEESFEGVVDLLTMKLYRFDRDTSGSMRVEEIPAAMKEALEQGRERLIEGVAESDDALLEKYLEEGVLTDEEISQALSKAILQGNIVPVLCGSAGLNVGIQPLMDLIAQALPDPTSRPPVEGTLPGSGEKVTLRREASESFSALVFKTIWDPYTGRMNVFRIFSGSLASDSQVYNPNKEARERMGQLFFLNGKKQEAVTDVVAGDIVGVAKLKETSTGDTLSEERRPILLPSLPVPQGVISYAIKPKSKGDEDKVAAGLTKLRDEDATIQIDRDEVTKDILLKGNGQKHIEVTVEKLRRKFGVEVSLDRPKVPYKETIRGHAKGQGRYKKQTGGRGQFGDTWMEVEPLERGKEFEFVDKIVGGVIPRNYIPACEKGVREAMAKGVLAGYQVVDIRVILYDGSYHPVDSSEMAFKIAASMGFKKIFMQADPVLLEPVMNMEIAVTEEYLGDVLGDLNQRRGRVQGIDSKGKNQIVHAQAPLSEVLDYAPRLTSITSGKGSFTLDFSHYDEVPAHMTTKVIAEAKAMEEE